LVFGDDQRGRVARASCSGLIGVEFISTPNGAKASQTALASAAGGATAPPSANGARILSRRATGSVAVAGQARDQPVGRFGRA